MGKVSGISRWWLGVVYVEVVLFIHLVSMHQWSPVLLIVQSNFLLLLSRLKQWRTSSHYWWLQHLFLQFKWCPKEHPQ